MVRSLSPSQSTTREKIMSNQFQNLKIPSLEKANKVLKQDNESLVTTLANINDLHSEEQSENKKLQKEVDELKQEKENLAIQLSQMTYLFEEEQRKCEARDQLIYELERKLHTSTQEIISLKIEAELLETSLAQANDLYSEEQSKNRELQKEIDNITDHLSE